MSCSPPEAVMELIGVDPASEEVPRRALRVLGEGGLVAFPTDTFYALGADARNEAAVERVFAAKRRPRGEPMPVLVVYPQARLMSHKVRTFVDECVGKLRRTAFD